MNRRAENSPRRRGTKVWAGQEESSDYWDAAAWCFLAIGLARTARRHLHDTIERVDACVKIVDSIRL
jgi:hypothetical protein